MREPPSSELLVKFNVTVVAVELTKIGLRGAHGLVAAFTNAIGEYSDHPITFLTR
jgi:hypothetical protein